MKKKVVAIFCTLLLSAILFEVARSWSLLCPYSHFPNKRIYKRFNIYSDNQIDESHLRIFDDVSERLAHVELADSNSAFEVFLCFNPELYGSFARKLGKPEETQGFNIQPLGYAFVSMSFIERMKRRYGPRYGYGILEGNAGHIIAHEIIHELIVDRVGFLKGRFLPSWKKEGYCEYSASHYNAKQDIDYSLEDVAERYSNGFYDNVGAGRRYYVFSKLLVEYLLTVKNLTFDELIESDLDEDVIYEEVHDWTTNKRLVR